MIQNTCGPLKKLRFLIKSLPYSQLRLYCSLIPGEKAAFEFKMRRKLFEEMVTEETHCDCMMFSQLLKRKGLDYAALTGRESRHDLLKVLAEDVVIVRMKEPGQFSLNPDRMEYVYCENGGLPAGRRWRDLVTELFRNGFKVQDEKKTVTYVRFGSSASMTRSGSVLFVNSEYISELNERVTLGLERDMSWASGLTVSKWDAYKGLSLSDGYSLEWLKWLKSRENSPGAPELNRNSVVVVPDMKWDGSTSCAVHMLDGAVLQDCGKDLPELPEKDADPNQLGELTDGVGFIDLKAARWLSRALCGSEDRVSTFQIRMPFVKGMLHGVDFKDYLKQRHVKKLQDVWGNHHPLNKIQIILPVSMFKAHKWFNALARKQGDETQAMKLYFSEFEKWGHDLFITQRFIAPPPGKRREDFRLNYEVLQTCGMPKEAFQKLRDVNLEQFRRYMTDRETRIRVFTGGEPGGAEPWDEDTDCVDMELMELGEGDDSPADPETPDEEFSSEEDAQAQNADSEDKPFSGREPSTDVNALLSKAISIQNDLVDSNMAKGILKRYCESLALKKILRGQLALPEGSQGESRYLCCDLGMYLDYLVTGGRNSGNRECGFQPMKAGEFYAPGFQTAQSHCALFRTPHYSRNEHLVLRPLREDTDPLRKKYFGHLTGVLMLPPEGFGAKRMGGADFDGDHVSIVDDPDYVDALERALGLKELTDEQRDKKGGSGLPFVSIPSAKTNKMSFTWSGPESVKKLPSIEADCFILGMDSRIGLFSNCAFSLGAEAYQADTPSREAQNKICALTALNGMEIDSVKTGEKPPLPTELVTDKGLFLTIASKAKHCDRINWKGSGDSKKKGKTLFLSDEMNQWASGVGKEAARNRNSALPCLLDSLPGALQEAYPSSKSGTVFSECFSLSPQPKIHEDLLQNLEALWESFHKRERNLSYSRLRQVSWKPDYDLARILWPRCVSRGTRKDFEELALASRKVFSSTDSQQRKKLRECLEETPRFEQSPGRLPAGEKIDMALTVSASGILRSEEAWNKLLPELTDFSYGGFCLIYILLHMAENQKETSPGSEGDSEFEQSDKDNLVKDLRRRARELCGQFFPGTNKEERDRILAAHLLEIVRSKSERFFWLVMGEDALKFIKEGGRTQ